MENVTRKQIESIVCKEGVALLSTHSKLCIPVIGRLYRKMKAGIPIPGIKVCNNLICDGHHRYIASLLAEIEIATIQTHITSATTITQWNEVVFEDIDWDKAEEVDRFNLQDAQYLEIEIHALLKMLD